MKKVEGFLLTRQWVESESAQDLVFWISTASGPAQIVIEEVESVFFIQDALLSEALKCLGSAVSFRYAGVNLKDFKNQAVIAFYFKSQKLLYIARSSLKNKGIYPLESDLRPTDRYLMERFITGSVSLDAESLASPANAGSPLYRNPVLRPGHYRPDLKVLSLDIETSYIDNTLYSIALATHDIEKVFMLGEEPSANEEPSAGGEPSAGEKPSASGQPSAKGQPQPKTGKEHLAEENQPITYDLQFLKTESEVIKAFLASVEEIDPDILIGWSVVNFDLSFLQSKCEQLGIDFNLGRHSKSVRWRAAKKTFSSSDTSFPERRYALVPGRAVLDGIEMLRSATYSFESYSLENVSRQLLGRGKLIEQVDGREDEINDLFARDKKQLAAYNLEDCRLVLDIFDKTDLVNFALERTSLTGLDLDRAGGSVAAFDYLYLPRLHRHGRVAPIVEGENGGVSPGGYVLDSVPGLYEHVIVLDFKSLYPSIIRTFNVDPLAMIESSGDNDNIPGFKGASFSRAAFILPTIIEELWSARDQAKQSADTALSHAIKIIMNSFYGVLGTPGCRFYDARLVSSITMRGHEILQKTRDLIQQFGYRVIYGDTDSLFVLLSDVSLKSEADLMGDKLVDHLNNWWTNYLVSTYAIKSCLELEYENYFEKFLMPTVRGSKKGSKKRYAGMVRNIEGEPEMVFKGLETVRSDWTPLARNFQKRLYLLVFTQQPFEGYILEIVKDVISGEKDEELLLRRRLRRPLAAYKKNVPPHARAAKIIEKERRQKGLPPLYERGGWVEYLMTLNGPEPKDYSTSAIDYQFYIDKQLMPVADAIISFKHRSFAQIIDKQIELF